MRMFLALLDLLSGALPPAARATSPSPAGTSGWHKPRRGAGVDPGVRAGLRAKRRDTPPDLDVATPLEVPAALRPGAAGSVAGSHNPVEVYQANWKVVPVTEAAYVKRLGQVCTVITGLSGSQRTAERQETELRSVRQFARQARTRTAYKRIPDMLEGTRNTRPIRNLDVDLLCNAALHLLLNGLSACRFEANDRACGRSGVPLEFLEDREAA